MQQGVLTSVDLNFSNQSSIEKTASISAIAAEHAFDFNGAAYPPDAVQGDLSGAVTIADSGLQELLNNFTITEISLSQDSNNKKLDFKLQDNLSLDLESIIVLLRNREVGPSGEFGYSGWVYNWTELPDNIKFVTGQPETYGPYGKQDPEWIPDKRTLVIGDIFNVVELEDTKGELWTKVYQNTGRQYYLETPPENDPYFYNYNFPVTGEAEEDRGSWQDSSIKLGYTLSDLISGLSDIGINYSGIPDEKEFLIEEGGSLGDVLSISASKLGYYMYTDPVANQIVWVDANAIDTYVVDSDIDTTDNDVISTSFTESIKKEVKVISYNTSEKSERRERPNRTQKNRPIKKSFKRLDLGDRLEASIEILMQAYYLMWNKGFLENETGTSYFSWFTKLWMFCMQRSADFRSAVDKIGYTATLRPDQIRNDNPIDVYSYGLTQLAAIDSQSARTREEREILKFIEGYCLPNGGGRPVLRQVYSPSNPVPLHLGWAYPLHELTDPRNDYLPFVKTYLDSGLGGIYMSGPVSEYRRTRIEWDLSQSDVQVIGPYFHLDFLRDIEELKPIADVLNIIDKDSNSYELVEDIIRFFYPNWSSDNYKDKYFFFAFSNPKKKFLKQPENALNITFSSAVTNTGVCIGSKLFFTDSGLWLGMRSYEAFDGYLTDSIDEYNKRKLQLVDKTNIAIPYIRKRNPLAEEEYRETEDDDIPTQVNYPEFDPNRSKRIIEIDYPKDGSGTEIALTNLNPISVDSYNTEGQNEVDAIKRNRKNTLETKTRKTSTTTFNGLKVPAFSPEISNISISFGASGIRTTITKSTLQFIPEDLSFTISKDNVARRNQRLFSRASASKRNSLRI